MHYYTSDESIKEMIDSGVLDEESVASLQAELSERKDYRATKEGREKE